MNKDEEERHDDEKGAADASSNNSNNSNSNKNIVGLVVRPNKNDIISCSSSSSNNTSWLDRIRHMQYGGNVQFRKIISNYTYEYLKMKARHHSNNNHNKDSDQVDSMELFNIEVMMLVHDIIREIQSMNPPGRFLEKDRNSGYWNEITNHEDIANIIKRALKEHESLHRSGSKILSSSSSSVTNSEEGSLKQDSSHSINHSETTDSSALTKENNHREKENLDQPGKCHPGKNMHVSEIMSKVSELIKKVNEIERKESFSSTELEESHGVINTETIKEKIVEAYPCPAKDQPSESVQGSEFNDGQTIEEGESQCVANKDTVVEGESIETSHHNPAKNMKEKENEEIKERLGDKLSVMPEKANESSAGYKGGKSYTSSSVHCQRMTQANQSVESEFLMFEDEITQENQDLIKNDRTGELGPGDIKECTSSKHQTTEKEPTADKNDAYSKEKRPLSIEMEKILGVLEDIAEETDDFLDDVLDYRNIRECNLKEQQQKLETLIEGKKSSDHSEHTEGNNDTSLEKINFLSKEMEKILDSLDEFVEEVDDFLDDVLDQRNDREGNLFEQQQELDSLLEVDGTFSNITPVEQKKNTCLQKKALSSKKYIHPKVWSTSDKPNKREPQIVNTEKSNNADSDFRYSTVNREQIFDQNDRRKHKLEQQQRSLSLLVKEEEDRRQNGSRKGDNTQRQKTEQKYSTAFTTCMQLLNGNRRFSAPLSQNADTNSEHGSTSPKGDDLESSSCEISDSSLSKSYFNLGEQGRISNTIETFCNVENCEKPSKNVDIGLVKMNKTIAQGEKAKNEKCKKSDIENICESKLKYGVNCDRDRDGNIIDKASSSRSWFRGGVKTVGSDFHEKQEREDMEKKGASFRDSREASATLIGIDNVIIRDDFCINIDKNDETVPIRLSDTECTLALVSPISYTDDSIVQSRDLKSMDPDDETSSYRTWLSRDVNMSPLEIKKGNNEMDVKDIEIKDREISGITYEGEIIDAKKQLDEISTDETNQSELCASSIYNDSKPVMEYRIKQNQPQVVNIHGGSKDLSDFDVLPTHKSSSTQKVVNCLSEGISPIDCRYNYNQSNQKLATEFQEKQRILDYGSENSSSIKGGHRGRGDTIRATDIGCNSKQSQIPFRYFNVQYDAEKSKTNPASSDESRSRVVYVSNSSFEEEIYTKLSGESRVENYSDKMEISLSKGNKGNLDESNSSFNLFHGDTSARGSDTDLKLNYQRWSPKDRKLICSRRDEDEGTDDNPSLTDARFDDDICLRDNSISLNGVHSNNDDDDDDSTITKESNRVLKESLILADDNLRDKSDASFGEQTEVSYSSDDSEDVRNDNCEENSYRTWSSRDTDLGSTDRYEYVEEDNDELTYESGGWSSNQEGDETNNNENTEIVLDVEISDEDNRNYAELKHDCHYYSSETEERSNISKESSRRDGAVSRNASVASFGEQRNTSYSSDASPSRDIEKARNGDCEENSYNTWSSRDTDTGSERDETLGYHERGEWSPNQEEEMMKTNDDTEIVIDTEESNEDSRNYAESKHDYHYNLPKIDERSNSSKESPRKDGTESRDVSVASLGEKREEFYSPDASRSRHIEEVGNDYNEDVSYKTWSSRDSELGSERDDYFSLWSPNQEEKKSNNNYTTEIFEDKNNGDLYDDDYPFGSDDFLEHHPMRQLLFSMLRTIAPIYEIADKDKERVVDRYEEWILPSRETILTDMVKIMVHRVSYFKEKRKDGGDTSSSLVWVLVDDCEALLRENIDNEINQIIEKKNSLLSFQDIINHFNDSMLLTDKKLSVALVVNAFPPSNSPFQRDGGLRTRKYDNTTTTASNSFSGKKIGPPSTVDVASVSGTTVSSVSLSSLLKPKPRKTPKKKKLYIHKRKSI